MDSYNYFSNKIVKSNFLQWASLRHSVPSHLKEISLDRSPISPSLIIGNKIFDIKDKKSKDYYSLLVSKKAQPPNIIRKLKSDFNFTTQQFTQIFSLPHLVALESYVKAFQYKVINSIVYTNSKLCKIGFRITDACMNECPHYKTFWTDFETYWYILSNEPIYLSAQNVLFGVLSKQGPLSNLLNYFIIIRKLFLWDCRRSQTLPKIQGLQSKLKIKYETEKNINKHSFFEKKWVLAPI